uniref:A-kinase anchor 110kDa C-terminal domain-containing protein n=2 Tax=Piliocolobus tephrosceles TaxID=591936 RepID=A0A8C9GQC6_9PRIM
MAHEAVELTAAEMRGTEEKSREGGQKSFLYSELSNKSKSGDKQMSQRESKELADSISKGLMVYANQVASDMMVSVMKTLKVYNSGKPVPACVVLKRVLLRHTKEIVSDLIDSCMKNLHSITGVLMTDSDFVSAVKRNLFNQWKQNAADIMEAMLKRLVSALIGEEKETKSQSLSYASLKAGSHDPKCRNQSLEFSTMKAEMKGRDKGKMKSDPCKSLTSAEKVGEHILKEGLTIWNQKQGNPCKVATKACGNTGEKGEKISASTDSLAKDLIVSALKLIQYHLTQQTKGKDTCEEDCPGSTMGYMAQSTQYEKWEGGQGAKALSVKHLESHRAPGPQNYQDSLGHEVIVNNQCSTNSLQKQLQAVLQWIAASQFNVPMLYFMGDKDGQLEKLPQVSAKAAEKGYSVGGLLQEVMKFAKEWQLDEAVGKVARKQLLDWLLDNL